MLRHADLNEVTNMGLFDVFSKGGKYFGKAIEPKCEYCEHGNRAKDGNKVLCTKKGLVDASYHCTKFLYSPLKRIPVKQLERVGWLEGNYDEKDFAAIQKKKEEEAKAAKAADAPAPAVTAPAPAASAPVTATVPKPAAPAPTTVTAAKPVTPVPPVTAAPKPVTPVSPATAAPKPVTPVSPATAAPKPVTPVAPARPVTSAAPAAPKPVTPAAPAVKPATGDLASLAAMAEAAGEYIPETESAEETPKEQDGMSALSSM